MLTQHVDQEPGKRNGAGLMRLRAEKTILPSTAVTLRCTRIRPCSRSMSATVSAAASPNRKPVNPSSSTSAPCSPAASASPRIYGPLGYGGAFVVQQALPNPVAVGLVEHGEV